MLAHSDLEQGALLWTIFGGHLRVAEAAGLNRGDYDRSTGVLKVVRQYPAGSIQTTPTKTGTTKAIRLPPPARAALEAHLDATSGEVWQPMFMGERAGRWLRRDMIRRKWNAARKEAGLERLNIHDVRYVGLTLEARSRAPLRDLMARGGHSTTVQAIRYQHASGE